MVEDNLRILLRWDKVDKVVYIYSDILGFTSGTNQKSRFVTFVNLPIF